MKKKPKLAKKTKTKPTPTPYPVGKPLKKKKNPAPVEPTQMESLYDYIERRQLAQREWIERALQLIRDEFEAFKTGAR